VTSLCGPLREAIVAECRNVIERQLKNVTTAFYNRLGYCLNFKPSGFLRKVLKKNTIFSKQSEVAHNNLGYFTIDYC
jgi:hypothetical protein